MDAKVEHHVHESPPSMTGVLMILAALSALGGFVALPHFLEPMLPLARTPETLHHYEMPLLILSVAIALAGLAGAWYVYGGGPDRAARLAARFAALHRTLVNKYFVDEAYDRLLGRPLVWLSDRVFLNLGDRVLLDGTLNGMARLAQRTAGVFSRVQTGNLHLYALLVLAGSVAVLAWSFGHV
jgi:NADH-quinone oxidoreductase subunit L